ncbi:cellulase-like family protein [Bauldia sp.]|uniref:cellulase-like family protein n=1 Tax=Bauldia sp. TaxID=2575872 RepID=UPI003BA91392
MLADLKRPRAITMWDFSWLERRWPGAGYEDWDQALDELVERGYDAVRIDCYPHFIGKDPNGRWLVSSDEQTGDWGTPGDLWIEPGPGLIAFIGKCRDRGIVVGMSTWFKDDPTHARMDIASAKQHADLWIATLRFVEEADPRLLNSILYVDLCNEFPHPKWAPFLYGRDRDVKAERLAGPRLTEWMAESIGGVRAAYPALDYTMSFSDQFADWDEMNLEPLDFLEPHIWMAHPALSDFAEKAGFSYSDPNRDFNRFVREAESLYLSDRATYHAVLTGWIEKAAEWSRRHGKPVITTECWAVINWRDWPMADWEWIKNICALGTRNAAATGRWSAIATSNFCGPQYRGMWRDISWHRALTDEIKAADLPGG